MSEWLLVLEESGNTPREILRISGVSSSGLSTKKETTVLLWNNRVILKTQDEICITWLLCDKNAIFLLGFAKAALKTREGSKSKCNHRLRIPDHSALGRVVHFQTTSNNLRQLRAILLRELVWNCKDKNVEVKRNWATSSKKRSILRRFLVPFSSDDSADERWGFCKSRGHPEVKLLSEVKDICTFGLLETELHLKYCHTAKWYFRWSWINFSSSHNVWESAWKNLDTGLAQEPQTLEQGKVF